MRVGAFAENLFERMLIKAGLAPIPVVDTQFAAVLTRAVVVATQLGIFEALGSSELTAEAVASRCQTEPQATRKLLNTLVASDYLDMKMGNYQLTRMSRKWLLKGSPTSVHDNMLFRPLELGWIEHMEEYVRTGKPLTIHQGLLSAKEWGLYQKGMRAFAGLVAPIAAKKTQVPQGARSMLDIGGSHGYYSVALCRRHPRLRSVILDLPEAVEHAAPILAKENMGDRVVHRAGDASKEDLGTEIHDLVLVAGLVHHFTAEGNRDLVKRIARALRPGGILVIQDIIRGSSPNEGGQLGQLMDLFFAITSESGTWAHEEMASWQRDAGLVALPPIRFYQLPGLGQQAARKP